jgi:hypothetical protein
LAVGSFLGFNVSVNIKSIYIYIGIFNSEICGVRKAQINFSAIPSAEYKKPGIYFVISGVRNCTIPKY